MTVEAGREPQEPIVQILYKAKMWQIIGVFIGDGWIWIDWRKRNVTGKGCN